MPSRALLVRLPEMLEDAHSLIAGARFLRLDRALTNAQLTAFSRSVVLACLSAWESYVEALVRESVEALRPASPPLGVWELLRGFAAGQVGNFHTPSALNTDRLLLQCLGTPSVQPAWRWQNTLPTQAAQRLGEALTDRHEISHGVHPRPHVDARFASLLPEFVTRLAQRTDAAVRQHLVGVHGIAHPWPA